MPDPLDCLSSQQNELKALFDAQPADPPVQTRFTRAQLRAQALAAEKPAAATGGADLDAGLEAGDDAPEEPAEVDPFSLLEPKDVSSNIPDNLEESLVCVPALCCRSPYRLPPVSPGLGPPFLTYMLDTDWRDLENPQGGSR